MNCHVPLFGLDPNADGVSHVSVFHRVSLDPNQKPRNASHGGLADPSASSRKKRIATNRLVELVVIGMGNDTLDA
jgi:hypothetical protein